MITHSQSAAPRVFADECEELCARFERACAAERSPRIEDWLPQGDTACPRELFGRLLAIELAHRALRGEVVRSPEYESRFPQFADEIEAEFRSLATVAADDSRQRSFSSTELWDRIAEALSTAAPRRAGDCVGRYVLEQRIGRGGFGEVWKARDPELARTVAVKLARPDRISPAMMTQLQTEARRAASLQHPSIVPVYDIARDQLGTYIVSEFVPGETLSVHLQRGPLPQAQALQIALQIAEALHHAHCQGLVHRDVKPSNVLLRPDGRAVLTDFGLAASEEEQLKESGGTLGTWRYMSPEQARGDSHLCDARTDIYSLGVVLYQMLTGRLPYRADDREEYLQQILERPPRPLRTINEHLSPELERICLKCLSKKVEDRYTTASDVAVELKTAFAAGDARDEPPLPTGNRPRGLSKPAWIAAACVVLAAGGIATAVLRSAGHDGARSGFTPADPGDRAVPSGVAESMTPGSILPNAWRSLLYDEPVMVSWDLAAGRDTPGFDRTARKYSVRSDRAQWIAQSGETDDAAFELRAVIEIDQWIGRGGLVWALGQDFDAFPRTGYRCLSVVFLGTDDEFPRAQLIVEELVMEENEYNIVQLKTGTRLASRDIEFPQNNSSVMSVVVSESELVVSFDDVEEWRPENLLDTNWRPADRDGLGLTGQGRRCTVRELAVRPLP